MAIKRYRVTDKAGSWVAGRKVSAGDVLELTPKQAEYEVARGLLVEVGASVQPTQPRAESAPRDMAIKIAPRTRRGR